MATAQFRLRAGQLQALKDGGLYPEAITAFSRAKDVGEALLAAGGSTEELLDILARAYVSAAIVFRFGPV